MHCGTEVNASQFVVKRLKVKVTLEAALSGFVSISRVFTKLTTVMYYGTEVNALCFGVKGSKFKVTVE